MAVQPNPFLQMTDGTTTVTFADGSGGQTSYAPLREGWAPAIAALRRSELGGVGPYEEVVEELEIIVSGADTATALANLGALARLLDQAEHWYRRGVPVSPVLIKYAPQGSTVASTASPLQAIVLGRAEGDETNLSLPIHFNDVGMIKEIRTVRVRFRRRGQWLNAATDSAASANATYPTIHTATFGSSATTLSPIDISIGGFTEASVFNFQAGYCLVAPSSRLIVIEGEAMTPSSSGTGTATATTVADAAKKASGGSVERWTGTTAFTGTVRGLSGTTSPFGATSALIAVFAAVRINNSTITGYWQVEGWSNAAIVSTGPQVPVEYASNQPQIINLGTIASRGGIDQLSYAFTGTLPIGTTLDIDYIAAIQLNDEASAVLGLADMVTNRLSALPGATVVALEIRSNALTDQTPAVAYRDAVNNITEFAGYMGTPYLMAIGTDVGFILLSTGSGPSGVGNAWRPATAAAGAAISSIVTVTRRLGYLVPT